MAGENHMAGLVESTLAVACTYIFLQLVSFIESKYAHLRVYFYTVVAVEVGSAGGPWSRRVVAAMERAELEDKHLGLMDENHVGQFVYMYHFWHA